MRSTYLSLHYHIVFSTKHRANTIHETWRERLHAYLAGTIQGFGGIPEQIGGMADHVHLLVRLRATHCLADFMRELKKASSTWIRETQNQPSFAWQEGYAAFTVSATNRDPIRQYIRNQPEHHRHKSFQEEFQEMLAKAGITHDPSGPE